VIFVLATFIGVLTIVLGSYWAFVLRPEDQAQRQLEKRMKPESVAQRASLADAHAGPAAGPLAAIDALLSRAAVRFSLHTFLGMSIASGLLVGAALRGATHLWLAACVGFLAGAALPLLWVRRQATKRLWLFEEQFPEAIELIARSLRAGHAFSTALSMVGEELPSPVGPEFKLLHDRQNFGMPMPEALRALADRVPSVDTRFFVTAVLTQREAGGNLSAVLDNLATVIRDRFTVKRQVRVVSAHGRMTAGFLMALPPAALLLQLWASPRSVALFFRDPLGIKILGIAATLQVAGMVVIRRLVNVKY
jgi:tight adherence protein B